MSRIHALRSTHLHAALSLLLLAPLGACQGRSRTEKEGTEDVNRTTATPGAATPSGQANQPGQVTAGGAASQQMYRGDDGTRRTGVAPETPPPTDRGNQGSAPGASGSLGGAADGTGGNMGGAADRTGSTHTGSTHTGSTHTGSTAGDTSKKTDDRTGGTKTDDRTGGTKTDDRTGTKTDDRTGSTKTDDKTGGTKKTDDNKKGSGTSSTDTTRTTAGDTNR